MNIRLLFILSTFFLQSLQAQPLDLEIVENPIYLENLLYDSFIQSEHSLIVANNTNEPYIIELETVELNIPDAWDLNFDPSVEINNFIIPSGITEVFQMLIELINPNGSAIGQGIHHLALRTLDIEGNLLAEEDIEIIYEVVLPNHPSPTFKVFNDSDSTEATRIFIPISFASEPGAIFHREFSIPFQDFWDIDRPIIFEPIEISVENISNIQHTNYDGFVEDPTKSWLLGDTIFHDARHLSVTGRMGLGGTVDDPSNFKYEVLVNIYDPIDSMASSQIVKFEVVSGDCVYGIDTDILGIGSDDIEICKGMTLNFTVPSEFTDISWTDWQSNQTFTSPSITLSNIQEHTGLDISARDEKGCLHIFNYRFRIMRTDYVEIIELSNIPEFVCEGQDITLEFPQNSQFSNPYWIIDGTNDTIFDTVFHLAEISESVIIELMATNSEGCEDKQQIYIVYKDYPQDAQIVPEYEYLVCRGADLQLTASDEFTSVQWMNEATGEIIPGQEIIYENIEEFTSIIISGIGPTGCAFEQLVLVIPEFEYVQDNRMVDLDEASIQTCHTKQLTTYDGYSEHEWSYRDINGNMIVFSNEQTATLELDPLIYQNEILVSVLARNEDNCFSKMEFHLQLNISESEELIDLSNLGNFCVGDDIDLGIAGGYTSFSWILDGVVFTDSVITIPASEEEIILQVTDDNGCVMQQRYTPRISNLDSPQMCLVTNDVGSGNNIILWENPADLSNVSHYTIAREGTTANVFDPIGEVIVGEPTIFTDTEADPTQQAYRYKVFANNTCGDRSSTPVFHKTIHLTINLGTNNNINLIFDEYIGISYDQIIIYRGSSPAELQEYVTLPSTVLSFTDQNPPLGDVFYQIVIPNDIECDTGRRLVKVQSNVASFGGVSAVDEIGLEGKIFPNPFTNELIIDSPISSKLQIIDIYGQVIIQHTLIPGLNKIATEDLSPAAYIVHITEGVNVFTETFIKTK